MVFVIHWHESAMDLHVFPIPIPPPTSLSTRSLWVFPVHQARALVSCIQPGLGICLTLDNIHVSMLFTWNSPPLPSPTESKILFCTSDGNDNLICKTEKETQMYRIDFWVFLKIVSLGYLETFPLWRTVLAAQALRAAPWSEPQG